MRIGFIGFGEAASAIAAGLKQEGVADIVAYDVADTPIVQSRAEAIHAHLVTSKEELARQADVILSMVTASVALNVAQDIAPYLRPGTVYADLNSCSPRTKREIYEMLENVAPEVEYASVAVMSAVPPLRHKVPMVADGPGAARLHERLSPYHMNIQVIQGPVGASAVLKMCRSVIVKGLEALFLEALVAADRAGVAEQVLASLDASFGSMSLSGMGDYLLRRHWVHGRRRAHEAQEAIRTVEELGAEAWVTRGVAQRLEWGAQMREQAASMPDELPSYRDVLRAFRLAEGDVQLD
ncbi:MAG: DUF1932 domain-containing protein [Firmicutes bacterium]|nr:DUF1932 domain-containing protein [Bacillota bacterium]